MFMGGRPRTGTGVGEKENCRPCLGSSEAGAELGPGVGGAGAVEGEPEKDDGGIVGEKDGGGDEEVEDSKKEVENRESVVAAATIIGAVVTESDCDCSEKGSGVGKNVGVIGDSLRLPIDDDFSDFPIWKNWKFPRPSSILCWCPNWSLFICRLTLLGTESISLAWVAWIMVLGPRGGRVMGGSTTLEPPNSPPRPPVVPARPPKWTKPPVPGKGL